MSLAQRILALHSDRERVTPGEFINVRVDLVMANDVTAPLTIEEFRRLGVGKVFDKNRVVLVQDHFVPARDVSTAEQSKAVREFAKEQDIIYYEVGKGGIEHIILPEDGLVLPGDVVIGGDSHTCTYGALGAFATGMGSTDIACAMATGDIWMKVPPSYKFIYKGRPPRWVGGKDLILYTISRIGVEGANYAAMEFSGEAIRELSLDDRFTMANMAVEAGAKVGLFEVDEKTLEYVKERARRPFSIPEPDGDYEKTFEFDVSALEPLVAFPNSPANVKAVTEARGIKVDQVFIGSCTNGRLKDLREAAGLMKGRKVSRGVRCVIIPGSNRILLQAIREGLVDIFLEAGAFVSSPTCGPCLGGHLGVIAAEERCLSTANRNFMGRMGSPRGEVYLASPAVAAATAIAGEIIHPKEVAE